MGECGSATYAEMGTYLRPTVILLDIAPFANRATPIDFFPAGSEKRRQDHDGDGENGFGTSGSHACYTFRLRNLGR